MLLLGLFLAALLGCSGRRGPSPEMQAKIDSMKTELAKYANNEIMMESYLAKFDTLDFVVFSNQEWVRLHESHSQDVLVNWPDGHQTSGIERHIEDLKALFVYAPDTNIKVHPIKFIKPTGKSFSVPMCTVGHWKDGVMIEESLFWDNATYTKQIGLTK
jgi:hypothetical protein